MKLRTRLPSATPWRELRLMLVLLVLAVVVPVASLLWFMGEAMGNERLAVRQRLADLYRAELHETGAELNAFWQRRADALGQRFVDEGPGERFARLVEAGIVHGAILFDESGSVAYPVSASGSMPADPRAAELRDRVRELLQAESIEGAAALVAGVQADPAWRNAMDAHGRLIVPDLQLLLLESAATAKRSRLFAIREDLESRIRDYGDPRLPSSQRRFLMARMQTLDPALEFPTLAAERLSDAVLHTDRPGRLSPQMSPGGLGQWWILPSVEGAIIGAYRPETMIDEMRAVVDKRAAMPGVEVRLSQANLAASSPDLSFPLGNRFLPGWELTMVLDSSDPFVAEADRRIGAYLGIGLLAVAAVATITALMAGVLLRQIRLTQLKNDFVATVSHELKTPLSSMRVLADTLLEGRVRDRQQERKYLHLIVRENERLTRLIDNFLSFSRMERNKRTFQFEEVDPLELVHTAADALAERFEEAGGRIELESAPDLPPILADRDAMVTVLVNLLDNAFKYSPNDKRVKIVTTHRDGHVRFAVEDRGVGLTPRESRRVMDRFYQVDQRLSRKTGGCGLGLSIVQFIVDAHHGEVEVRSRPGEGATFTVQLAATTPNAAAAPEPGVSHG
jgi:signal transduction histidine kinase